jgi:hypothetical protein
MKAVSQLGSYTVHLGGRYGQTCSFSRVAEEVNRVMARPEINGAPVALDFSSKGALKGGGSSLYSKGHERIFGGGAAKLHKSNNIKEPTEYEEEAAEK